MQHKFQVGDKVVYTNSFGVCWGVKVITELDERSERPTYHYEDSDTPWYSVCETNFVLADENDIKAQEAGLDNYFQKKYGFEPTMEQLGGCY